jgi:hypothetical protein
MRYGTRRTVEVLSLRKTADKVPASGLGLMLGEVRDLSGKLQRIFLEEQVAELVAAMSRCPQCAVALPVKDAKNIVYRTAFGKAKLASPRLYSSCSSCGPSRMLEIPSVRWPRHCQREPILNGFGFRRATPARCRTSSRASFSLIALQAPQNFRPRAFDRTFSASGQA